MNRTPRKRAAPAQKKKKTRCSRVKVARVEPRSAEIELVVLSDDDDDEQELVVLFDSAKRSTSQETDCVGGVGTESDVTQSGHQDVQRTPHPDNPEKQMQSNSQKTDCVGGVGNESDVTNNGHCDVQRTPPLANPENQMQNEADCSDHKALQANSQGIIVTDDSADPELRWFNKNEPDTKPLAFKFKPARDPGPSLDKTSTWNPLTLFQLFFSASVIRTIIDNTNKKAILHKQSGIKRKWEPLDVKDFFKYLSVVLYGSLINVHQQIDLWKKALPYNFPFPANTMTRDRFLAIHAALHLCDPEEDEKNDKKKGTPDYDRLFKLKPLYTDLINSCKANFQPYRNISIDERMVASKARISFKQYMKNKPTKWGYKLFVLADSSTGYTWNFYIYTGKSSAVREQTLGYSTVINLMSLPLLGRGYNLYVDNFYTSPSLFQDLHTKQIACCGTLRKHVNGYPNVSENDFPKKASRGDIRWLRKKNVLFVKWMDSREVVLCSTMHQAFSGQTIKRTLKEDNKWVEKQLPCPDAIVDYNKHMGGVDLSDALLGYYKVQRKTKKWYKTLFFHFVDIAVVNAFLLHKELVKARGGKTNIAVQKQFREILLREMLTFAKFSEPVTPSRTPSSLTCLPMYYESQSVGKNCFNCREAGRKRVKTQVYCRKCLIPLCFLASRNCFTEWHDANVSEVRFQSPKAKKSLF